MELVVPADAVSVARQVLQSEGFLVERDWLPTAIAFGHPDAKRTASRIDITRVPTTHRIHGLRAQEI